MPDNPDNDTTQLLLRYLDNELPPAEAASLAERLQADATLYEQYQHLLFAQSAIRSYGASQRVRQLYAAHLEEMQATAASPRIIHHTRLFRMLGRVAAVVALVVAGYATYIYASTNKEAVYSRHYISYTVPVHRGGSSTVAIDSLYNSGNYTRVLQALQNKSNKTQREYFLEGQSCLNTGNTNKAIEAFKQVEARNARHGERLFAEETDYYLLLAFIKAGDIEQARRKRAAIVANGEHLFYENAKQISQLQLTILSFKQ